MSGSLQDQLLKTGLADAKKAKSLDKEKRKQAKVARRAGVDLVDESKVAARQMLEDKAQRDRALNHDLNHKAQRKAINAQIKQLVEANKLARGKGDTAFNFSDGKKVKSFYVTAMEQKQLTAGRLAIVKQGDQYEMVPRPVADKIAERDDSRIIALGETSGEELTAEEQEWYKDYDIPDDLMW